MDFIYLFRVLMKKKWIIIGAALIASVIAFVFTRNQQKKYKSFAQVSTGFTQSEEIRLNPSDDNAAGYNEADIKFNNVLTTATSPTVLSLLSYALILHDLQNPYPFRQVSEKDRQSQTYQSINKVDAIRVFSSKLEAMSPLNTYGAGDRQLLALLEMYGYDYKDLISNLSVYRLPRTDYIQIEFLSENPELSAAVVNTLYYQFLRYYRTVRSNRSIESIDTLQSLLDRKKQDLDVKNEQLRSEGIINVGQENGAKFQMIIDQQQILADIETKQTGDNYALQQVNQQLAGMGVSTTPGKPSANTGTNDELLQARTAMNNAYSAYINSGAADENLKKTYERLKVEYNQKVAAAAQNSTGTTIDPSTGTDQKTKLLEKKSMLEVNLRAEAANIDQIQNRIGGLQVNLTKDASKAAALQSLIKEADLANKEYLDAKQRFNEASDIMASSVNNFRLILIGQPPLEPESSKRVLIIGLAGAFMLVISILVITLMTYFDSSLKTPIIFAKTVNFKLLSMVNFTNLRNKTLSELIIEPVGLPRTSRHPSRIAADSKATVENNRQNVFRESIRKLRYEIENSGKSIFLFASTKKGEGKTTLIQMLAFSLSLNKKRVLIIDTNFSNNDLTVQLDADPILERIHPDRSNPRNLLEQVRTAAKNVIGESVYVIGSQGGDYTPSEILPRENLLQQLQALKADFDFIFLEGPPLNDFSDTKELSQYVEGVIAVFSSHHVIKQIDKQSMSFFSELNGKFCGAILNMVDLEDVNAV
jgi:succinoglycan biosynthesis transport protein ExoP